MPNALPNATKSLASTAGNGRYTASSRAARNAALCIAGETECATGRPTIPYTSVAAGTERNRATTMSVSAVNMRGTQRERLGEQPAPLVLRSAELTPFPDGPARHDDRSAASCERASHVRIADRIEPQLDQVRIGDRVAVLAQLRRGRSGH